MESKIINLIMRVFLDIRHIFFLFGMAMFYTFMTYKDTLFLGFSTAFLACYLGLAYLETTREGGKR